MENKKTFTQDQLNRIIEVGRRLWKSLSSEEQETYGIVDGTYGFVENVVAILHLYDYEFGSEQEFEQVHDKIIGCNREVFGMYCKEYDMTFIVEQEFDNEGEPKSLEVKGLYYGEPEEGQNLKFYGDLVIDYTI